MSSQIRGLFALIVGLVFMYFFVQTANSIGAPSIFTIVAVFGALLMILKFGRILIRGF
jgi:hypothetical protein